MTFQFLVPCKKLARFWRTRPIGTRFSQLPNDSRCQALLQSNVHFRDSGSHSLCLTHYLPFRCKIPRKYKNMQQPCMAGLWAANRALNYVPYQDSNHMSSHIQLYTHTLSEGHPTLAWPHPSEGHGATSGFPSKQGLPMEPSLRIQEAPVLEQVCRTLPYLCKLQRLSETP
jgi:hypothetical protein